MQDELCSGQRTMEDPHAATWEDEQWSKAGGDTWRSLGCNKVSGGGRNLRAGGVPQIGTCCLGAVKRRSDALPPFPPADGMRPD